MDGVPVPIWPNLFLTQNITDNVKRGTRFGFHFTGNGTRNGTYSLSSHAEGYGPELHTKVCGTGGWQACNIQLPAIFR